MNDMTPDRNERKANLKGLGTSESVSKMRVLHRARVTMSTI